MLKFFRSPLTRISFGLVMLTVAMLVTAAFLGLLPDTKTAEFESRKIISESIAVQVSTALINQQLDGASDALDSVVKRNTGILSAAIRKSNGVVLVAFGHHEKNWTLLQQGKSTLRQIQVPIFNNEGRWGAVELRFSDAGDVSWFPYKGSLVAVILFVAVVGFVTYMLFLKRTMRELDPNQVIPERVRMALDTLSEGLLIIDHEGYIVFSNSAFAEKIQQVSKSLIGKKSTEFDWEIDSGDIAEMELPWLSVLGGKEVSQGIPLRLNIEQKDTLIHSYTFTVNCSPITTSDEGVRGVLVTFDDITELEIKNEELRKTLDKLKHTQREVTRQNQELQVLANMDSLTNVLNRRAFFAGLETVFEQSRELGQVLSFIMVDIDHFKTVNDRYGHAVGDVVIKLLAKILSEESRPNDLVGRFGGEEFCVVLPGATQEAGVCVAERMRVIIESLSPPELKGTSITSSFGVSTLTDEITDFNELVVKADDALYVAKENGRNRVIFWSDSMAQGILTDQPPVSDKALLLCAAKEALSPAHEAPNKLSDSDVVQNQV
ncbi:MAG: sensor domain-containing diguanylate cyclase [Porticoccus sp.]|nr:sensor domain-containing diguanylate cyclase [Porticoccus sp.]MBQ0807420.1 sensor domain-containing diguanylate cyclase [Porticoccus sp.]